MKAWRQIVLKGLTSKSGEEYAIVIGAPEKIDGSFACRLQLPGIVDSLIRGENALSCLISALRVAEAQVYEPSPLLIAETTLSVDDYPDLSVLIECTP